MAQKKVFKSGYYTDASGRQVYGVNPADVENYYKKSSSEPRQKKKDPLQRLPTSQSIIDQFIKTGSIVGSSNEIRDERTMNRNNANKLMNGIQDLDLLMNAQLRNLLSSSLYTQTPEGQSANDELTRMRKSLGIFTQDEESQISSAGEAEYQRYAPMIRAAEEAKRQGMPKAIIGGGERGGFMNTQISGVAALAPTEGGDFVGEGGELNRVKSVYDQNIQNAISQALAAKTAAEASARQAIRTGKRQDYDLAEEAFNKSQEASQNAIALANEKADAVSNYLNNQYKGVEFAQGQEDRVIKQAQDKIDYFLDNFGTDYWDQNKGEIAQLFRQAGFTGSDTDKMLEAYKKKAEEARLKDLPKPELRSVGNSLYAVSYDDKTGSWKTELLVSKPTGGGGGGSTKITDAERKSEIDQYLYDNNLFGQDNRVSWETYLAMKQTWVNNGGDESSFELNYPIGIYLDEGNQADYKRLLGIE